MPRALWKGSLAFGLVNIPIELHTAVRGHRPRFRLLHAHDRSPVRLEHVCVRDGHAVAWEDLVKGYEYEKGHFVVLTKEDFRAAAVEHAHTVEILDFVKGDEIDDRFFETPYYLVPAKSGARGYALLRETIRETGRVAVARFVLHDAQHLAAIEAIGKALVLSIMRFADELVDASTLPFPPASGIRKAELKMAKALVDSFAASWEPSKYTDQYRDNLMRIIRGKAKGKHVGLAPLARPRQAEVVDLMERLRQSLAGAGNAGRRTKTSRKPSAKKPRHAA